MFKNCVIYISQPRIVPIVCATSQSSLDLGDFEIEIMLWCIMCHSRVYSFCALVRVRSRVCCDLLVYTDLLLFYSFYLGTLSTFNMTYLAISTWTSQLRFVYWTERCVVRSNCPVEIPLPSGSGLDYDNTEAFHFSLLKEHTWSNDKFWYLAFLPKFPSFTRDPLLHIMGRSSTTFPIVEDPSGYFLEPAFSKKWLELEDCLRDTYNILKQKYLQLVPLQTTVPRWPSSTQFDGYYASEEDVRYAAHRARRLYLAWICLVCACVAASDTLVTLDPPQWYRELCRADTKFPAYWLDNILKSRFFALSDLTPRRGLTINMAQEYGLLGNMKMFLNCAVPVYLCFPHGCEYTWRLPQLICPTTAQWEETRQRAIKRQGPLDTLVVTPPHTQVLGSGVSVYTAGASSLETSALIPSHSQVSSSASLPHGDDNPLTTTYVSPSLADVDRIKMLARLRAQDRSNTLPEVLDNSQLDQYSTTKQVLHRASTVHEWKWIEFHPWIERVIVAEEDKLEVWNSYLPAARFYIHSEDTWECVSESALPLITDCSDPLCRDLTQDGDDVVDERDMLIGRRHRPDTVDDPQPSLNMNSCHEDRAESDRLPFSLADMEDFCDTLKYRYGIKLPSGLSVPKHRLGQYRKPLLDCVYAMVAEESLNDIGWQDVRIFGLLESFFESLLLKRDVLQQVSDCHMDYDEFVRDQNVRNLSVRRVKMNDLSVCYMIGAMDSVPLGWHILAKNQVTTREILRRRWGPGAMQIVAGMVKTGLPFLFLSPAPLTSTHIPSSLLANVYREEGYQFSRWDYEEYASARLALLKIPSVARAALRQGGIIWRLCMECGVDSDVYSNLHVDRKGLQSRQCSMNGMEMWEDVMPPELVDKIVGVYKVFTGKSGD